jgi:hypothetical protein
MRWYAWFALTAIGCSGHGPGDDDTPPDPKGWTITIDMSALDRFVQPATAKTWPIAGTAAASEGLVGVDVAGMPATLTNDGAFTATAAVMPGLVTVPILARDAAGHERKGDRTLLATRYLAEGNHGANAASIVLTDAILSAMGAGLAGQAGTIDVAGEILSRSILSQDDRCTTWPLAAHQDAVTVELAQDRGDLWLHIQIPHLHVDFGGTCQGLIQQIPIAGEFGGTLDVWSQLHGTPPADGACLTAFTHAQPEVQILGWGFDVWGTGGPLQNWIIELFKGDKATQAHDELVTEVQTRADTMLSDKLAHIAVFDRTSNVDLLGRPLTMHLCLGALDKIGTKLVARVSAVAHGGGARMAPGAPQIDGAAPTPVANELVLDANLVAQLLYQSWRDGGLARSAPDVDANALDALIPGLYDRHPGANAAQVAIDGELPPYVRATPGATGALSVELGDLMVNLSMDGEQILRFGVVLTLSLDLQPKGGKLVPMVLAATAKVALLDELLDGPDPVLEKAVEIQIGNTAAALLGDNAGIALPDLPGLGAPLSVAPDTGGRFLHVKLAPP